MNAKIIFAGVLVMILLPLPAAFAQDFTIHQMKFTINGPVEFPGRVLQAGTYFIRRDTVPLRQGTDSVIEVLDKDRQHVLLSTIGIYAKRSQPLPEPFEFFEVAKGAPPAVRSWYLPGNYEGYDFVYPKHVAAVVQPTPVLAEYSPLPEPVVEPIASAPVLVEKPSEPIAVPAPPAPEPAPVEPAPPTELPKTAGEIPLLGFIGLMLLAGAAARSLARKAGSR